MGKIKVMTVFGTRPEAIKMAPLVKELKSRPEIEHLIDELLTLDNRTDHLCYGTAPSDAGSGTGDFPYCTGI